MGADRMAVKEYTQMILDKTVSDDTVFEELCKFVGDNPPQLSDSECNELLAQITKNRPPVSLAILVGGCCRNEEDYEELLSDCNLTQGATLLDIARAQIRDEQKLNNKE